MRLADGTYSQDYMRLILKKNTYRDLHEGDYSRRRQTTMCWLLKSKVTASASSCISVSFAFGFNGRVACPAHCRSCPV